MEKLHRPMFTGLEKPHGVCPLFDGGGTLHCSLILIYLPFHLRNASPNSIYPLRLTKRQATSRIGLLSKRTCASAING